MDSGLMLQIIHRQVDAGSKALLTQAVSQLSLLEVAVDDFALALRQAPGQSSNDAQSGISSSSEHGASVDALIMGAIATRSATAIMIALRTHLMAPDARANLRARTFIYELALFIKMLEQIEAGRRDMVSLSVPITVLKAIVPDAINLRDSLAHFDERTLGRAHKKAIKAIPHQTGSEVVNLGLHRAGSTYGGHSANGTFVGVKIDQSVVTACRAALVSTLEAFPEGPDFRQVMTNHQNSMSN